MKQASKSKYSTLLCQVMKLKLGAIRLEEFVQHEPDDFFAWASKFRKIASSFLTRAS